MNEEDKGGLTPISVLGEFRFIEHISKSFENQGDSLVKGVGDDAAVYKIGEGKVHVLSTDFLIEGIHFDLSYVPLKHLGYKSVVVNLSDIYAMNANPFGITISVAMSNRFTVEAMDEFYEGVKMACEKYNVDLLGGDTSSSNSGLVISVTAVGIADEAKVVYRNGAKVNDLVCVSGNLGAAYAGLQVLEREKRVFLANPEIQPDLSGRDYVVGRQLKPEARRDIVDMLTIEGVLPTSMIDISDGLASEIHHLCKQSDTGAQLFEEKIPIDTETGFVAEEFNVHPMTFALNGGEDYELLFTIRLEDFDKVSAMIDVHVIGHITNSDEGIHLINPSGAMYEVTAQGWDHFDS